MNTNPNPNPAPSGDLTDALRAVLDDPYATKRQRATAYASTVPAHVLELLRTYPTPEKVQPHAVRPLARDLTEAALMLLMVAADYRLEAMKQEQQEQREKGTDQ